jgi:hypothetical protein
LTAHDTGQGDWLCFISDQKHLVRELSLLAIQGHKSLSFDCTPNYGVTPGTLSVPGEVDCYAVPLLATQTINAHVVGSTQAAA